MRHAEPHARPRALIPPYEHSVADDRAPVSRLPTPRWGRLTATGCSGLPEHALPRAVTAAGRQPRRQRWARPSRASRRSDALNQRTMPDGKCGSPPATSLLAPSVLVTGRTGSRNAARNPRAVRMRGARTPRPGTMLPDTAPPGRESPGCCRQLPGPSHYGGKAHTCRTGAIVSPSSASRVSRAASDRPQPGGSMKRCHPSDTLGASP